MSKSRWRRRTFLNDSLNSASHLALPSISSCSSFSRKSSSGVVLNAPDGVGNNLLKEVSSFWRNLSIDRLIVDSGFLVSGPVSDVEQCQEYQQGNREPKRCRCTRVEGSWIEQSAGACGQQVLEVIAGWRV